MWIKLALLGLGLNHFKNKIMSKLSNKLQKHINKLSVQNGYPRRKLNYTEYLDVLTKAHKYTFQPQKLNSEQGVKVSDTTKPNSSTQS